MAPEGIMITFFGSVAFASSYTIFIHDDKDTAGETEVSAK
jgi:hypothetical protein